MDQGNECTYEILDPGNEHNDQFEYWGPELKKGFRSGHGHLSTGCNNEVQVLNAIDNEFKDPGPEYNNKVQDPKPKYNNE